MFVLGKSNLYIKPKMYIDMKKLRRFYLNRGYADFQINYVRAFLDKKKKNILLYIDIFEGDKHRFRRVTILSKDTKIRDSVDKIIEFHIRNGEPFSQKKINRAKREVNNFFHLHGFFNSKATYKIVTTDNNYTDVEYSYNLFNKVIVKRIYFRGNHTTDEITLRKFVRQMEACVISIDRIVDAKYDIIKAGYAKKITFRFKKAKDNSSVAITFNLKEKRISKIVAGCNYNRKHGLLFHTNAEFANFFGTGKDIAIGINKNKSVTDYTLNIICPNVSNNIKNVDFHYQLFYKLENKMVREMMDIRASSFGFSGVLSFKLSKHSRFHLGVGADKTSLRVPGFAAVPKIRHFVNKHGLKYKEYYLTFVYIYSSITKRFIPREGTFSKITLRVTTPISELKYFIISYDFTYFKSLSKDFMFNLIFNIHYGNKYGNTKKYPFYKQFSLLGKGNVRGYVPKTLGPRPYRARHIYFGGNLLFTMKLSLFFPLPIISKTKRIKSALFFDLGQTYETYDKMTTRPAELPLYAKYNSFLKTSFGLTITILTPIGLPIDITFAYPINATVLDETTNINISISTTNIKQPR